MGRVRVRSKATKRPVKRSSPGVVTLKKGGKAVHVSVENLLPEHYVGSSSEEVVRIRAARSQLVKLMPALGYSDTPSLMGAVARSSMSHPPSPSPSRSPSPSPSPAPSLSPSRQHSLHPPPPSPPPMRAGSVGGCVIRTVSGCVWLLWTVLVNCVCVLLTMIIVIGVLLALSRIYAHAYN